MRSLTLSSLLFLGLVGGCYQAEDDPRFDPADRLSESQVQALTAPPTSPGTYMLEGRVLQLRFDEDKTGALLVTQIDAGEKTLEVEVLPGSKGLDIGLGDSRFPQASAVEDLWQRIEELNAELAACRASK